MASSTSSYLGRFSILPPFMQTGKIGKTIPVNQTQLQAIDTMIRDQPSIPMSMKNFQDEVLVNPFDVIIAGDDEADSRTVLSLKPEITHLISTYWMPWLQEMDTQTLSYGYCPFYFRYITYQVPVEPNDEQGKEESENDDDDDDDIIPPLNIPRIRNKVKLVKDVLLYYPVTPKRGLGSTETFIFDKEQYLIWKWNDSVANDKSVAGLNTYDTSMYFIIENMPDIMTGNCTNPMASLISHWQELVELRKQNTIMIKNMANPEHAVEYNPSLTSSMSSQNRAYIEGAHPNPFFPSITVGRPAQVAQDSQSQQLVSAINAVTQYQQNTLLPSMNYDQGAVNAGLDPMAQIISSGGAPRIDPQARALDAFNLFMNQNQELLPLVNVIQQSIPNAHYLKPYQHYVAMAKPTTNITQEIAHLEEKFNQLASTVLNSPIELYVGTDRNSKISAKPGIESQQMFLHKRIRWRIKFFCGAVKQVFTIAFLNMFQRARNDIERLRYYHFTHNRSIEDVMKLERMLDFQVVFKPSASNMEMSQIIEFYRHGIIDEDAAFNMFFQKIGFTDPPVKAPVEFKERMQDLYRKTREEEANLQTNAKTKKREREELVRQPKAKKSKKDETDSPSKKKKD